MEMGIGDGPVWESSGMRNEMQTPCNHQPIENERKHIMLIHQDDFLRLVARCSK